MPGKSRKSRAKRSFQSKKRKGLGPSHIAAQQPAATPAPEPVVSSKAAAPAATVSAPVTKPAAIRYPFIATELRRIGILAGIMLVVLIVLVVVLA